MFRDIFKFDHSKKALSEALGIPEPDLDKLSDLVQNLDKKYDKTSQMIQKIVNSDDLNSCEKIYALFSLGRLKEMKRKKRKGAIVIGDVPEEVMEAIKDADTPSELLKIIKSLHEKGHGCDGDCKDCKEDE
jgi:hypothetical protein